MSIVCASLDDGTMAVEICDDGVGLPEGFDPLKDGGLGFDLIRSLAHTIGATLHIESSELGLCFQMALEADREAESWMRVCECADSGLGVRP